MWRRVRELTAEDTTLVWVTSHEKRVGWQPEQGPLSAEEARALNARADEYASEVLQVHKREHEEGLARRAAAAAWSKRAVEVQVEKTRDFHATWCRLVQTEALAGEARRPAAPQAEGGEDAAGSA